MAGSFDIAKAGWLYRQSSVLHRWKKNWFVLDREGNLRYFDSPDTPRAEERLVVRAVVTQIRTGPDVRRRVDPPEGLSSTKACYLELGIRDNEAMLLCAESFDDMRAWQIALDEARAMPVPPAPPGVVSTTTIVAPPGYVHTSNMWGGYGYPGHVISTAPVMGAQPAQVIHTPGGTTTVVQAPAPQQIVYVDDGPYRYNRRYYRGGFYPAPMFFW